MPLRLRLRFFSLLLFELVTVTELDEISLARRLLAGDADAFEPFVNLFHSKLFQFTYMTCGQREDAEEVAQETLLKVFQNLHQLREPEHIRAWVFRIARNVCSLKHRKSVFAPTQELSLDELRPGFHGEGEGRKLEIADWKKLPDEAAIQGELNVALRKAIHELPDDYRSVLLLRDVEGMSTKETAHVLEIGEDAVKMRLHRARLAARKKIDSFLLGQGSGK